MLKGNKKIGCAIIIIIVLIFYVFYSLWASSIINNLSNQENAINSKWHEIFEASSDRIDILKGLKLFDTDSLKVSLMRNINGRNKYKDENTIQFVEFENNLNEEILKLQPSLNDDFLKNIKQNDNKLNMLIEEYNGLVLGYNKYISIFPNFYVAKKQGVKRKKFFEIVYGKHNEAPVEQVPEWMQKIEESKGINN